jgi:hypothetical protein
MGTDELITRRSIEQDSYFWDGVILQFYVSEGSTANTGASGARGQRTKGNTDFPYII